MQLRWAGLGNGLDWAGLNLTDLHIGLVITNTSKPESVPKKKSNSICYHFIREVLRNFADMLTKVLYGKKRKDLIGGVLHFIYDDFE